MREWTVIVYGQVLSCIAKIHFPGENHFKNVRQLTFGGVNTEAYFSFNDHYLTLQAAGYGTNCDQIYRLDLNKSANQAMDRISTGIGSCTCSFFYPNNKDILYAGNFHKTKMNAKKGTNDDSCPVRKCQSPEAKVDPKLKQLCNTSYTWDIFPTYDIFKVNEYGNIIAQLTNNNVYDAEAVISPDGTKILYTSMENGDLDLYLMDLDGSNKKQITNTLGYDGGGFFSPDIIIWFPPTEMELYVVNVDGTEMRPVFKDGLGRANWAPYYLFDNKRIIFSSNFNSTGYDYNSFDLYIVDEDGTNLEKITHDEKYFDSFPMFSHRGDKIVWASSRGSKKPTDINIFIADWVDSPREEEEEEFADSWEKAKEEMLITNRVRQIANTTRVVWQNTSTLSFDGIVHFEGERHFKNVNKLTFGGQNR
ncbi:hypothetical protein KIN20_036574 [Parelaphostrongylus tenuis]|uniref:Uncharacterized protein n=1 Tax=Parelaphostrongylus tenuis TaxID=148309 RepID=A0AAD5RGD3_PARTN|nr:hypothetical protein KIN20_036574 [Parelaphostrongylus tenuis]